MSFARVYLVPHATLGSFRFCVTNQPTTLADGPKEIMVRTVYIRAIMRHTAQETCSVSFQRARVECAGCSSKWIHRFVDVYNLKIPDTVL